VRAAEHCPVSILQARGDDAIPEVALWAIDRFVAVTPTLAVEPPQLVCLDNNHFVHVARPLVVS